MPDTTTTVIGNLTDNLEVHDTENGIARARFRVAEPGASSTDAAGRDAGSMLAFRSVQQGNHCARPITTSCAGRIAV